jgi:hypothetical protein
LGHPCQHHDNRAGHGFGMLAITPAGVPEGATHGVGQTAIKCHEGIGICLSKYRQATGSASEYLT